MSGPSRTSSLRVAFAGGGSGGHLAPALAIRERLLEADPRVESLQLCSDRAVDAAMLSDHGVAFEPLPSAPLKRSLAGLRDFLKGQSAAIRAAIGVLRRFEPDVVVAVGGFASVAGVVAARRLGVPAVLCNLDVHPGRANRIVRPLCRRTVSSVDVPNRRGFEEVVGPFLRSASRPPGDPATCRRSLGLDPHRPTLLITGASQGAISLNRLPPLWLSREPSAFVGWQILHLAGGGEVQPLRDAYAAAGVLAKVEPFLHPMGLAWGAASLAISRAGANSVAEIHANAVPSVLVPYPFHRDRHQWLNAAPLVELGGAVVVEDRIEPEANLATIAAAAERLLRDAPKRLAMANALRKTPPRDGAAAVARMLIDRAW
ncbi:MAG: UDP-N-acetylglucosamine--N-acetylmuramyl-(pentapeptide) pyrophosphoryl-undecaprenol N-acetylglucosamine transferase [Phycisphaerales bacterium]